MNDKKIKRISILLSLSILLNFVFLMVLWNKKRFENYAVYYIFNNHLNTIHSSIREIDNALIEMKTNGSSNDHELLVAISDSYYKLEFTRAFMNKMHHFDKSFDFDIDNFHAYLLSLAHYSNQDRRITDEDIRHLEKIISIEKDLIPRDYLPLFVEDSYYDKLIPLANSFSELRHPSKELRDAFKEIERISSDGSSHIFETLPPK